MGTGLELPGLEGSSTGDRDHRTGEEGRSAEDAVGTADTDDIENVVDIGDAGNVMGAGKAVDAEDAEDAGASGEESLRDSMVWILLGSCAKRNRFGTFGAISNCANEIKGGVTGELVDGELAKLDVRECVSDGGLSQ